MSIRYEQALKKLSPGTLRGRSKVATPVSKAERPRSLRPTATGGCCCYHLIGVTTQGIGPFSDSVSVYVGEAASISSVVVTAADGTLTATIGGQAFSDGTSTPSPALSYVAGDKFTVAISTSDVLVGTIRLDGLCGYQALTISGGG